MDAINAVEKACFAALSAPGAVTATVAQHARAGLPYPIVIIGDIDTVQPIGRPDDPDRSMRLSILVLTEGEERKPCSLLMAQAEAALNDKRLIVDDWLIAPQLEVADARIAEDGAGYVGLALFTVHALKN